MANLHIFTTEHLLDTEECQELEMSMENRLADEGVNDIVIVFAGVKYARSFPIVDVEDKANGVQ
jgi:anti-anti-sigma regulatory factor